MLIDTGALKISTEYLLSSILLSSQVHTPHQPVSRAIKYPWKIIFPEKKKKEASLNFVRASYFFFFFLSENFIRSKILVRRISLDFYIVTINLGIFFSFSQSNPINFLLTLKLH